MRRGAPPRGRPGWRGRGAALALALPLLLLGGPACNPFAPRHDPDGLDALNLLGDPRTLEGFFRLFKNAYELRDTSLYGQLLAPDFVFAYYDAQQGQEMNWSRDVELTVSHKLFWASTQINLDWNFFVQRDTTPTEAFVVRNFNLSIQQPEGTLTGSGRARMYLRRASAAEPWRAYYWFDDSDF